MNPTSALTAVATRSNSATSPRPTATASGTDSCGSATVTIDYAPFTTAELAAAPWELVVADVTAIGPAFFNTNDGARPPVPDRPSRTGDPNPNAELMVYTPVEVEVQRSIKGPFVPGPDQVLTAGGVVGCYTMSVYPTPEVEVGTRYVFILATAYDDSGDELPSKDVRFAWLVDDGIVATVDGPMTIEELTGIASGTSPR